MHLRWSITNPYLIFDGGPGMAPKPPNDSSQARLGRRTACGFALPRAPGNPWRSSVSRALLEQHVPPDAHAGQGDHEEQYALECAARQPPAGHRAELRAGHRAEGDDEGRAERNLSGDELADDAARGRERGDRERAADRHADGHADDHEQQWHEEKGAARADETRREADTAGHRRRQRAAVLAV